MFPLDEPLHVTRCVEGDRLDLSNRHDLERFGPCDPRHHFNRAKSDLIHTMGTGRPRRHQHAGGEAFLPQGGRALEEQVVGFQILDEDDVARYWVGLTDKTTRDADAPPPGCKPENKDDQRQQSNAQAPGGPDAYFPVPEMPRPPRRP